MSKQVDERVVSMQFDNKHFEQNVQTSLSTLDKLKRSLNMDGASKGLESVNAAAKNVNMTGLGSAVETVQAKFSALGVMGVTALANITNSAVNAGKRIVSALTIDPVKTGFNEYETKINSIQTIMSNTASKGTTMEDVTRVIDDLNTYADKTIYNFAEMTRNIGTFTAAGVGLEESASAIKGIANLAAASGSSSQQASTAMYQLSQALATGTVKLMDWNSVVNAGMGGEKFQEALKATAREHGIAIDSLIKDYGSFRESLQNGWLSADILNETLNKFTVDGAKNYAQSMIDAGKWTQKQADALIKEAQAMEDAATKVKTFTQLWDTLKESAQSGWSQTWEIIVGDFEEAKETLSEFSDVIGEMIGASADARNSLLQGWKDAGGRADLIDALYNAFKGIMDIVKPIKEAFREIFPPITVDRLVGLTKGLKELTEKFKLSEGTADKLKRTFKGVFAVFSIVAQAVKALFSGFSKLVGYISPAGDGILGFTANIGDFLVGVDKAIKSSNIFNKAIEGIGKILKPIAKGVKTFAKIITDTFAEIGEKVEGRFKPLSAMGEFIKKVFVGVGNAISKVAPIFGSIASKVGEAFKGIQEKISGAIQNADYNSLFDILNGGLFAAILLGIKKFIKSLTGITDSASGFLENIKGILGGVGDALNAFTGQIKANTLKTIAISIAILAGSLLVLSLIDSEKLAASLGAITALFIELFAAMSIFGKISEGKKFDSIGKISRAMIGLSTALLVLSVAMKILSTMSLEEMGVALLGMTAGLAALVVAVSLLPEKDIKKSAKAIKKLSSALLILSVAFKIMSTISLREMGVALLGMVVGLGALVAAVNLLPKSTALKAMGMISLAASMVILAGALKIMATMSWGDIARSLVVLAGSLTILSVAMRFMKKAISGAVALPVIASGLVILGGALKIMSSLSWEEIARGLVALAGALAIIALGMALMKKAIPGAAALLIVSAALAVLTPILMGLGSMDLAEIGKALLALAGTFAVLGLAGLILKPVIPAILALSAAITLFGVGCLAAGVGVLAFSAGLAALAVSGAAGGAALVAVISGLIGLIPYIIEQIGIGIIKLCEVIADGSDAICKAVTVIILAVVDAIVASVPKIVDGVLILLEKLLTSLVKYAPIVVDLLFDLIIGVLNKLAERMPELIQAGVNLIMSFFSGVIDALKNIDPDILLKGILGVGFLTTLMAALASMAFLTGPALVGVIGMGAVITELGIVLSVIGALAQIPGLEWLVTEGGNFLQKVGTAIGQFIGGLVGGIGLGISSALPQIGKNLSSFMRNIQPFVDGAKMIDPSAMDGVKSLVGIIMSLTAANVLEGLTAWFTGGSSLAKFGAEISAFAPHIKSYANTVKGIDASAVEASVNAAKCLSELAANLPNSGGLAGWFAGENDIGAFGEQLIPFGLGMKEYSQAISGFDADAVIASANAATALAEMASHVPNEGGVAAWFAGENSIAKFGTDLVELGNGLKEYSLAITGFDSEAVIASVNAAKALAEMTSHIPNEGGMVAWFTGENSVARFAVDLIALGGGLKAYSTAIIGFDAEAVIASANAAKALAEMTSHIPNEGGVAAWFAGDNSIAKFGNDLISLGIGLKGFSMAVVGLNTESVIAAANAAKILAEMTSTIPNEGGVVSWFTGENSLSKFSNDIVLLGNGLLGFSNAVVGINPESVIAASSAAKTLAEMTSYIPNEGGVVSWFTGEKSISKFGTDLISLGVGLQGFATSVSGINPENVTAAAGAAKSLSEMTAHIPNEGGITAWFSGERSVSKFSSELPALGAGLKGFSDAVVGINPENVSAAAGAAKSLSEMTAHIPNEGGIVSWFSGDKSMSKFADGLPTLGKGLKGFSDSVVGINPENVTAAANAGKTLAEMTETTPKNTDKLQSFGANLVKFGEKLSSYFAKTSGISSESIAASEKATQAISSFGTDINPDAIKSACEAIDKMVKAMKNASSIKESTTDGFSKALEKLGKTNAEALIDSFADMHSKVKKAGESLITKVADGMNDKKTALTKACSDIASNGAKSIEKEKSRFSSAGANLVTGFANGISSSSYKAAAKARAMARAAAQAAESELGIHSPSKVGYGIGGYFGLGFVNALGDYEDRVYEASSNMADSARSGLGKAISRIKDTIDSDMDTQPTIRPVLDLSDVESGASAIGNMLTGRTLSVSTRSANTISSSMLGLQNGTNLDVISAIKDLGKSLGSGSGDSYTINGITYDDGSNITDAVQTLIRAAKVERRR